MEGSRNVGALDIHWGSLWPVSASIWTFEGSDGDVKWLIVAPWARCVLLLLPTGAVVGYIYFEEIASLFIVRITSAHEQSAPSSRGW